MQKQATLRETSSLLRLFGSSLLSGGASAAVSPHSFHCCIFLAAPSQRRRALLEPIPRQLGGQTCSLCCNIHGGRVLSGGAPRCNFKSAVMEQLSQMLHWFIATETHARRGSARATDLTDKVCCRNLQNSNCIAAASQELTSERSNCQWVVILQRAREMLA